MKERLRSHGLKTVCEEATCPNLGSCFREGVATVMVLGRICTRACPFCDVDHGKPSPPDLDEPARLAALVKETGVRFLVVTSVDRDDLPDGGAGHFRDIVKTLRREIPDLGIEILVPDFRRSLDLSLSLLRNIEIDVFNHNLETVPSLYSIVRPGADYRHSLRLLSRFSSENPGIPVKSGIMVGLGEAAPDVREVLSDLRDSGVTIVTIGQYLPPSLSHLPVSRYVHPDEFLAMGEEARQMGFSVVESGPLVRSSYHAEKLLKAQEDTFLLTYRERSI